MAKKSFNDGITASVIVDNLTIHNHLILLLLSKFTNKLRLVTVPTEESTNIRVQKTKQEQRTYNECALSTYNSV